MLFLQYNSLQKLSSMIISYIIIKLKKNFFFNFSNLFIIKVLSFVQKSKIINYINKIYKVWLWGGSGVTSIVTNCISWSIVLIKY